MDGAASRQPFPLTATLTLIPLSGQGLDLSPTVTLTVTLTLIGLDAQALDFSCEGWQV